MVVARAVLKITVTLKGTPFHSNNMGIKGRHSSCEGIGYIKQIDFAIVQNQ